MNVILKTLSLCNFKGEKERTTEFNANVTTISGGNGLGKSRHFDAFVWLLFGKDTQDRKDYEIKTRVNGEELHQVECSVTGVLDIDGEELTIKRAFVEEWVKPRGQVEQVFKGNRTDCWWNGVPVKVGEYDKRIQNIIDASVFKMLTNPMYFANMKWQLQREQLFQIAGNITDNEIIAEHPEFSAFLDVLSKKSLNDHRIELAARKKRLKAELEQVQPRIDQTTKMTPAASDFEALRTQLSEIDKQIADLDEQIASVTASARAAFEAEQKKQAAIVALKGEQAEIIANARIAENERVRVANADRIDLESKIRSQKTAIRDNELRIQMMTRDFDAIVKEREVLMFRKETKTAERDKMREEWHNANAVQFNDDEKCPFCGQPMPAEQVEKSRAKFVADKAHRLNTISATGKRVASELAAIEVSIAEREKAIDAKNAEIVAMREETTSMESYLSELETKLAEMSVAVANEIVPENIAEWTAKQAEIDAIRSTMGNVSTDVDTTEIQAKKRELNANRESVVAELGNEVQIERCNREIERLTEEGRKVAQAIADIERDEYQIQQFTKAKINECESRINGKFEIVSFRLFDYTQEGNPVETCIPLINGVPYGSANTASQINAGLDIIRVLSRFYNTTAPIFIDNRESVNEIIPMASQIINLVVTNESKLTIK